MKMQLAEGSALKVKTDLLALPVFEEEIADKKSRSSALSQADAKLGGLLLEAAAEEDFRGKAEQAFTFHTHGQLSATRVALLGMGKREELVPERLRAAAGKAARIAEKAQAARMALALPKHGVAEDLAKAAAEGAVLAAYRFDRYKTQDKNGRRAPPAELTLLLPEGGRATAKIASALELGREVAEATNWARDLVNEPAGKLTPTALAKAAQAMAAKAGLRIQVQGQKEIERLKMGLFLGVTRGSAEPPQLIHVWYQPQAAAAKKRAPLALVGKAITFDSGGLSLKTAEGMMDMKIDMAGSAAVFAAMRVIGRLKPPFPVHAFVGACENMPGGRAYKPGDVLVSRSGKTVEVLNTDAEGRLVLGDVLTWATEHKPFALIDLATLTGACMVALGHYIVGAFGTDDALAGQLLEAAKIAGEEMWRLPISELQRDNVKSEVADLKNSGERYGGALNAALFLKEFVGQTPWMHLDIAGPAGSPKERSYQPKGATGVGVRTLVELVRRASEA